MTWYSVATPEEEERLLGAWSDAPTENEELCSMLLDIARVQVMAFAAEDDEPALQVAYLLETLGFDTTLIGAVLALLEPLWPVDPAPPARYTYAQLQQAQNLWNAGAAGPDGAVGAEGYSFTPRPLDKTIRTIIRPTSGGASVY